MAVRLETLKGQGLAAALPHVARLRIAVFREWPYLYEGTQDYEEHYLAELAKAQDGVIVVAFDGDDIVGAATASPLDQHSPEFAPLFAQNGAEPETVFYFGESVLLPAFRGQRLGHGFFDHRERAARSAVTKDGRQFVQTAFCAVVRSPDDPRRPPIYAPLDPFWRKRGYSPVDGMIGSYSWKEIGAGAESDHPMQFWLKALHP